LANTFLVLGAMGIMIKRVQQEDENGCGIACVAMVTGKTYPHAKKFFLEQVYLPTDRKPHTRHYQLCRALRKLRIATQKRAFRNWCSIERLSIVPINRRQDGGWHWIVYVPNSGHPYILDPAPEKGRRRYDFRGMKARGLYIAVLMSKRSNPKMGLKEESDGRH
jgi:ABC-type bacteriocin/lantibiotic exporter with double-glycine peptidase domain